MASNARLESLHLKPFFSDRSHLLFYGCSSTSAQCKPIKAHRHTELTLSSTPLAKQSPPHSELDLLTELAVLKTQAKLKKKQLKAIAKEKKTAFKKTKTKDKGKGKSSTSSSSSSSSSEASDGGSMPCSKRLLKRREDFVSQNKGDEKQDVALRGEPHGLDHIDLPQGRYAGTTPPQIEPYRLPSSEEHAYTYSMIPSDREGRISGPPHGALSTGRTHGISGIVEVCVGGKCKKAGSNQLLSCFKAQIPASARVDATPCKCLGRCGAAISVMVRKEGTNPQHHSHVSVDDVGLILSHHFGLGPPLSSLPSCSSLSARRSSPFTAQV